MHELWPQLMAAHRDRDVRDHPFYRRWASGDLHRQELAIYAGQYGHVVRAIAEALRRAGNCAPAEHRAAISAHTREQAWHVELWEGFASSVGAPVLATATDETKAMTDELTEFDSWQEGLLGVYALESTQGPVASNKLAGLHLYGVVERAARTYFRIHSDRDDEHAAELRVQLEPHLAPETAEYLERALSIWSANWALLDGVDRLAATKGWDAATKPAAPAS